MVASGKALGQLPRMDLPRAGGDPTDWLMKCEYYVDMYQVPFVYKSRMAILNLSEEVSEWYRCLKVGTHHMPWDSLL